MPAGIQRPNREAAMTLPLAAPHRAVSEGGGDVVQFGLVQLLVDTLTPVLEDDGDLRGKRRR